MVTGAAYAQVDRTKAPEPGPAPEINLGDYNMFELKNGLKVIVVENDKLPRVQFSLILNQEAVKEGDKAGYASLAGQMLRQGTKSMNKAQLDEAIDFIGASLGTSSNGIFASSLKKHQDRLLELMTEILYNPSFPQEELDKLTKQTLSGLQAEKESPDAIASNVSSVLTYGKEHPYGEIPTEETISNVSLEDIKGFYSKYFTPNNAYLAIVGDIDVEEARELTDKYFSQWKKSGKIKESFDDPERPEQRIIAVVDRPNAVQSVITISYPIELEPGDENIPAARLLNQILGGGFSSRLMQNLREDKAYTYGARSSLSTDELIGRFNASASVRNEVTDSAVHEFINELEKIRNEKVTEEELAAAKAYVTGSFARSLESPSTVASFAVNIDRYNLPKDYYQNYLKKIAEVTIADIQAAAKTYILPDQAIVTVVGKGDEIGKKLERFGKVQSYDIYGNPEKEVESSGMPSPDEVLQSYIEAIGGKAKLEEVDRIIMRSSASIQGQTINLVQMTDQKEERLLNMVMLGFQEMQKTMYNKGDVKVLVQGREMPVDKKTRETMANSIYIFPELHYDKMNAEMEMKGIKKVNGQEAYKIQIKMPDGPTMTEYFSVETGLKLKTEGAPTGPVTYEDYTEYDGIKFPNTMKISSPQGTLEANVTSLEINAEIPEVLFEED